ncbi:MAG TPA: hypothetical protein VLY82_07925 [Nitrososphaerales archaeon]|nr:hypothetical protein [Nitrososphaerales archaeon]
MNRPTGAVLVSFAIALLFTGSAVLAAQPTSGSAEYRITAATPMGAHSILVNETVKGPDGTGFSDVSLEFIGGTQNLTYSRLENSSRVLLPFLPTIPSQSFSYGNRTFSVQANLTQAGLKPVTFQGSSYTMTVYDISLSVSYGNRSFSAVGTIEAFPSSLVYSVELSSGILFQASIVLQETDLPLSQPSTATATAAYAGAGLGVVGVAAAAAVVVRHRDRHAKAQEQKPLHWVD